MGLEDTFGKVEKPKEEKKLEIITSEDSVVDELRAYFEQNKYESIRCWEECKKYFGSCMKFLKSFKLNPKIITEFNIRAENIIEKEAVGIYLSAMIQTSYNQGFNNFIFEKVNTVGFCGLLKGQPKKPIKITAEILKGHYNLWDANSCLVEIQNYKGTCFGLGMENCTIKSKNEETLEMIKGQLVFSHEKDNRFELIK